MCFVYFIFYLHHMADTPIFGKKNVLITGGAGFIGSHLCERMLKEANVICMDDFSNSSIHNIEHLLQYPNFEFIKCDVNNPIVLEEYDELDKFNIKFQGVQEIYHLACPTSPKQFESHKIQTLYANSSAMVATLNLAVKYRAKYVFSSSSVVYGPPATPGMFFKETHVGQTDHLSERACYDEGKKFAETCIETYRQGYGVDAKIARVFTAYGPKMKLRDGLLVPDFIMNALNGTDLIVYGDESLSGSLCYVTDIVDGLARLMRAKPDVFLVNLGSDEAVKMVDVANYIINITHSSSKIVFHEPLTFLTEKGIPDLQKVKKALEWIPLVRLEDGLRQVVDYTIANKEIIG